MKTQIKFLAALLLIAAAFALTGCNTTTFTKTADGSVSIVNRRCLWTTDSYDCQWNTNGASLTVNKSGTDKESLGALLDVAKSLANKAP